MPLFPSYFFIPNPYPPSQIYYEWFMGQYQMNFQQLLREEHYLLKNQITQLKNAFNINRDILSILTKSDIRDDPQHSVFLKIIAKLTSINNQAMMNTFELMQEKNALKTEIYRLNVELNRLEERLDQELESGNKMVTCPTDAKMLLHEQFTKLSRQLLAFNQERIAYEQQIAYWKQNCIKREKVGQEQIEEIYKKTPFEKKNKVKRKYTSNETVKNDWIVLQQQKQIKKLKQIIEELQNRLEILIKAHKLEEQASRSKQEMAKHQSQWDKKLQQIDLFKYALNVITVRKKNDDLYMNILHRFRSHIDPQLKQKRIVRSWPKYKQFKYEIKDQENMGKLLEKTEKTEDQK